MIIVIDTNDSRLREVLGHEIGQITGPIDYRITHLAASLDWFSKNYPVQMTDEDADRLLLLIQAATGRKYTAQVMPETAPHAPGNTASKAAAKKIRPLLSGIRLDVFRVIQGAGMAGLTGSQIAAQLGINLYTAKPRCTELRDAGYIRDSGGTRPNSHGNDETVWVPVVPAHGALRA